MSRRHHGGRPSRPGPAARPDPFRSAGPASGSVARQPSSDEHLSPNPAHHDERPGPAATAPETPQGATDAGRVATLVADERQRQPTGDSGPSAADHDERNGAGAGHDRPIRDLRSLDSPASSGCTAPQLRRFIKSRPYVPMHELRRRFGIDGNDDDVVPVDLGHGKVFIGLPPREGALLGDLLRGGEIGFELSLDPRSPVVVGLYPMRPVART